MSKPAALTTPASGALVNMVEGEKNVEIDKQDQPQSNPDDEPNK